MKCLIRHVQTVIAAFVFGYLFAQVCLAQQPSFTPYKSSGIYRIGERVGWTVDLPAGSSRTSAFTYTARKNNQEVIKTGTLDFSTGRASIEVTINEPAMIYVQISPAGGTAKDPAIALGAAVAPEKLRPSAARPSDFDEFWASKIKALNTVPENAVLTPKDSGRPDVDYAIIRMDNVGGAHVYGQIAKPKRPGKFPALVIFQWASPPYPLQRQWVTDRAAEGWLAINIEPHDVLPDQPQPYYDALPEELKNYHLLGREDRDKNYFLQMYLADYRAVDYIIRRPDWNGKTLVVMGTSMGGQQSLVVAGLHPRITHAVVNEPAGCDTNGPLHGRASGYPNWPSDNPQIMRTALYFDPVNFAPRIKATSLVSMGFVDTVTPPVGIWIAFNQIKGPKEAVPMIDSPHNHQATPAQQLPYSRRSAEWLNTLVKGGEVKPKSDFNFRSAATNSASVAAAAGRPIQRGADQNSMLARAELLEPKKRSHRRVFRRRFNHAPLGYERRAVQTFTPTGNKIFFGQNIDRTFTLSRTTVPFIHRTTMITNLKILNVDANYY